MSHSTRRNQAASLQPKHGARGKDRLRERKDRSWDKLSARVPANPRQRLRLTCELAGLGSKAKIEPELAERDICFKL